MAYFQGCLRSGTVVFLLLPNPLGDASLRLCRVTLGQQPPVILDVHVVGAAERSETPRKRRARSATNDRQSRRAIGWPACVSGMQVAALTLIASQEASAQEAPAEQCMLVLFPAYLQVALRCSSCIHWMRRG